MRLCIINRKIQIASDFISEMEIFMEIFVVAWLVAPIILGILLILKSKKNKSLKASVEELRRMLESQKALLDEYRKQNKALQQALREARGEKKDSNEAAEVVKESAVSQISESVKTERIDVPVEPVEIKAPKTKAKQGIAPGTALFGIGILLVLAAGAIFATTTWNILPAFGKIAVLLGAVAVFYGGAFIAEKKLELRNTSITFYILGSAFLAIINLAAGYFEWYGPYYSLSGDGGMALWSISAFIVAVTMIVGALIYKNKVLGMIGYYALLLSVVLFNVFAFDDIVPVMICVGIVLLATHAYVMFVEQPREIDVIGSSARVIGYVFHVVNVFICMFYYGIGKDDVTFWPFIGLVILAIINLGLALWRMLTDFREEDVTNTLEERLDCAKKFNIIAVGLGIVTLGVSFRIPFLLYQRFIIGLFIFMIIYAVLLLYRRKDIRFEKIEECVSWFAQITLSLAFFCGCLGWNSDVFAVGAIVLLIFSAILYVMEHISCENRNAFFSAGVFFISIAYLLDYLLYEDNKLIIVIAAWVIAAVAIVAGRLIYKTVVATDEAGTRIDWISIGSIILLFYAAEISWNNDITGFFASLMIAGYIASFYRRSNFIVDRILLTVSTVLAMVILANQPFFEVPYDFEAEWLILFMLATTAIVAFVWRKYKRACSLLWLISIALAFMTEFDSATDYSYRAGNIGMIKVVIYLAGMIALFIISYLNKKKTLLIETGFAMVGFSIMAWAYEAKGIFILAGIFGIAYLVYLHIKGMSKWAFLPIVQIYVLLFALDLPTAGWFAVYAVAMLAGFGLHLLWDNDAEKSFADDMVNISAIIPIIVLWCDGGSKWEFAALIMLSVYFLSFYRRYNDNPYATVNKAILTLSSATVAIAWITQPWFEISDRWKAEWIILAFMGVCIFNMLVVYRQQTDELWGWITFAAALISAIIQGENAIATGQVTDALVLGVVMLAVLIWAYMTKKKQWFLLAGITLIAQSIYASRKFWMSIAWWVYLLAAGALLIIIAARSEYKRRKGIENEPDRPHAFSEWTL